MHDIEPYHRWRDQYIASEDSKSPFYGREYDEFHFTNQIYNYLIHPQWDAFGSPTLYMKILYVDYEERFAVLEFLGEWNDCLQNDIATLKRKIVDLLSSQGISKYILICENVLNFHGSDDCYYEEWREDVSEENGWIAFVNMLHHVETEMRDTSIHHFVHLGGKLNDIEWRMQKPKSLMRYIESMLSSITRELSC
jgi:hypothetical protein